MNNLMWQDEPRIGFSRTDFDKFVEWSFDVGASDILIESGELLALKINGNVVEVSKKAISSANLKEVLSSIYLPAADAILKNGDELNFKYQILRDDNSFIRFRLNATACQGGEGVQDGIELVIRTIPGEVPHYKALSIQKELMKAITSDVGIFFVTGPTGSGKSTSLAAMMREIIETQQKHIITYESPIEFDLKSIPNKRSRIIQSEIPNNLKDYRIATANSLRRAPDVILFGEGRDKVTIAACILEAQTGHFVMTTLHANNCSLAFSRMADEFEASERKGIITKLIDATKGIMHQRLYPKIGGGRVAIREYIIFDMALKRHLHVQLAKGFDISSEMEKIVTTHGLPLLGDAFEKFKEGMIDLDSYAQIVAEVGQPSDLDCVPDVAADLLSKEIITEDIYNEWMESIEDAE